MDTRNLAMDTRRNAMDTAGAGDIMVFVKVRETYDLNNQTGKMTLIGIHTPKASIIKANYPGLLQNCKYYRPVSADVRCACASMLPVDPLQVGTASGDVAPEDMFNPILYKACTNESFSMVESRILQSIHNTAGLDVDGHSLNADTNPVTGQTDDFGIYYGLLADAHGWKHANPTAGFEMHDLVPLVHERLFSFGGVSSGSNNSLELPGPGPGAGSTIATYPYSMRGNAKRMPRMPCTQFTNSTSTLIAQGFNDYSPGNVQSVVPEVPTLVGCIIIPPSRLQQLFYRMVVEWTIEFSEIRSVIEITNWTGLNNMGGTTHWQNYSYTATSKALGLEDSALKNDTALVSTNAEIEKVM